MDNDLTPANDQVPQRGNRYTEEQRDAIVTDAMARILTGETLAEIAARHGVSVPSLHIWLSRLGDEYIDLRRTWIDGMLTEAKTAIDTSDDQLSLSRAREQWRSAAWYAERRDAQRYGVKQDQAPASITIIVER